jgi:hypothetical protein
MNDDAFADRRRATEEDYFRKRDNELIDKMRSQTERTGARQRLSERVGGANDDLVQRLEAIGFTEETVLLLHLMPLVHVAWIEGTVSQRAAHQIFEAARDHGIEARSEADHQLQEWLRIRPSDMLFDEALLALSTLLQQRTRIDRERDAQDLLERCTAIAAASGGVLGFGKISSREREVLDRIRRALESPPQTTRTSSGERDGS